MENKNMRETTKNWIGLGIMAVAGAALVAGSTGIYRSLSRIGRPISETAIYTPGIYTGESRGYGGPVTVQVEVTDREIVSIQVAGEKETPEIGGKVLNDLPFLMLRSQSAEVDSVSGATKTSEALKKAVNKALAQARGEEIQEQDSSAAEPMTLADGEYVYEDGQFDEKGYKNVIKLTVENGAIVSCDWDAVNEAGEGKKQLSMEGKYVMTEDGLLWADQAKALAEYVVENQTASGLADEEGYTDAVSGVSINIFGFVNGVEDCMRQAAGETAVAKALADGEYVYEDEEFDEKGYKNVIKLTVENGAIVSCDWDAVNEAGEGKKQLSMEGKYVMTEDGLLWADQAKALAEYVVENQTASGLADEEGYTDAVSGVSINVYGFVNGVEDCMRQAAGETAVAKALADGEYVYEDEEFDEKGYKNVIKLTVENGAIVSCDWDAVNEAGEGKKQLSMEGKYVMTEDGLLWADQAKALAEYVVENQTASGLADEEGYTDAVSGVSINVYGFVNGVEDCMRQAAK